MAGVLRRAQPLAAFTGRQLQREFRRGMVKNAEGTGPPRVLITGGLGQLGSDLAKNLRYVA